MQIYRLAPMTPWLRTLTLALFAIPAAFIVAVFVGYNFFIGPFVLFCALYAWVWLRFRPSAFVVGPDALEVIWPLKRRKLPRDSIVSLKIIDLKGLKTEIGWGARVGAGGLWGGFGWLWTRKRGIVQMYVSRTDTFVWIERGGDRPWVITPERPDDFLREMSQTAAVSTRPVEPGDSTAQRTNP